MIYLPMLIIILERDRLSKRPFKLKGPYVKLVDQANEKLIRAELKDTSIYLRRHNMKLIRNKTDDTFTEYVFMYGGYEEHRTLLERSLT